MSKAGIAVSIVIAVFSPPAFRIIPGVQLNVYQYGFGYIARR